MDRVIREFDLEPVDELHAQEARPDGNGASASNPNKSGRADAAREESVRSENGADQQTDDASSRQKNSGNDHIAVTGAFLVACLLLDLNPMAAQGAHPQNLDAIIKGTAWEAGYARLARANKSQRSSELEHWLKSLEDRASYESEIRHQLYVLLIEEKRRRDSTDLVLSAKEPVKSAREFGARCRPTLMHVNDDWLDFDGAGYIEVEDATIRSELYRFLAGAQQKNGKALTPRAATVSNVVDAVKAVTHRPRDRFVSPCWLLGSEPKATEIIACQNGLLHLPSGKLYRRTPSFYTRNALPFDFSPKAPRPRRWETFLGEIWPGQPQEIDTLQEIFGYLLVLDTSQQKIFMLVGPARSGKGTIGRVLTHLVGKRNMCAPMLSSLSGDFGLQPLIGKQLALVSDMRLGHRTDQAALAENLLRISGEDSVDVARKYKDPWTGQLAVRFFIMTNILPRFVDVSGVLASRFVPLIMRESFVGRENPRLLNELLAELPGIMNWGIEGWRRLHGRGHFVPPTASSAATQQLRDLASPHAAFIRDRCELAPEAVTPKKWMFDAWKRWCDDHGHHHGAMETFSTGLLAAANGKIETCKPREEGGRVPSYRGIRLNDDYMPPRDDPPF